MDAVFERVVGFFARDVSLILWDLADIALVAVVLYSILLFVKGTRAMHMGIGLGLVFIVYQAAKRMGLVTLYAMLDTLLTSLVLIIVVVFQQEIRRALMRFGRRSLFATATSATESVIEEVVRAANVLAQKRIGALIVFERDAALDEFIEAGTVLDADLTKELLYSIFVPSFENPLHDGAVVIRDGRIQQAGAFLPLTASTKLDRNLGTRHRAAIGLTEDTDAVVVVVSEERGKISLCFNGNIARDLDAGSLRTALAGLFLRRARKATRKSDTPRPSQVPNTEGKSAVQGEGAVAAESEPVAAGDEPTPAAADDRPTSPGGAQ